MDQASQPRGWLAPLGAPTELVPSSRGQVLVDAVVCCGGGDDDDDDDEVAIK